MSAENRHSEQDSLINTRTQRKQVNFSQLVHLLALRAGIMAWNASNRYASRNSNLLFGVVSEFVRERQSIAKSDNTHKSRAFVRVCAIRSTSDFGPAQRSEAAQSDAHRVR